MNGDKCIHLYNHCQLLRHLSAWCGRLQPENNVWRVKRKQNFTLSKGSIRTAKFIIWKKKKYELNDQDESLTTNDWLPPVKEILRIIIVTVGIILEAENIKEYSLGTALVFRAQASFINSQRYWVDWYEKMVKLERRLYKVFISFVFCQNLYL